MPFPAFFAENANQLIFCYIYTKVTITIKIIKNEQ